MSIWKKLLNANCLFLLPALILVCIFAIFPIFQALWMSFTDAELLCSGFTWVGIENYRKLLSDSNFHTSLGATFWFVSGSVLLQFLMGMGAALLLHNVRAKFSQLFRSLLILPFTLSELVVGILWLRILDSEFGLANAIVYLSGGTPQPWLYSWAMPATIIVNVWWGTTFSLLLFEAALKSIPDEWYEAARVDGASAGFQFRHVTLPALKYVIFLDLVYITLFTINTFGILFVLTFGGPGHSTEVLGLYMWKQAFRDYRLGYGAAISMVLFSINIVLTALYLKFFGRQVLVEERF
jgi:multiple sugar transport system permease protein